MLKLTKTLTAFLLLAGAAVAQEPTPPKEQTSIEIPKTKGAYLIVAIQPNPLVAAMTSAKACEDERSRIAEQKITSYCIWVR
jgi:hypothetical protein